MKRVRIEHKRAEVLQSEGLYVQAVYWYNNTIDMLRVIAIWERDVDKKLLLVNRASAIEHHVRAMTKLIKKMEALEGKEKEEV